MPPVIWTVQPRQEYCNRFVAVMDLFALTTAFLILCGISGFPYTKGDKYHPKRTAREVKNKIHEIPYADWDMIATETLEKVLRRTQNTNRAKNVIFFLGDGMGVSTLTTARVFQAQEQRVTLDKSHLAWDDFHHSSLIKTYNSDASTPDSAGTATAFNCGKKARMSTIGVDETVVYEDCSTMGPETACKSALHHAMEQGKWGGIVTTTRVTHATPAAAFAHSPSRLWEHYNQVPAADRNRCTDIAKQLIHTDINKDLRIILGGGRSMFTTVNDNDPEYPNLKGYRPDSNLIEDWKRFKREDNIPDAKFSYVTDQAGFAAVDTDNTDYLFGLFEPSHMQYTLDRDEDVGGEPTLAEMVEKSIKLLSRGDQGYFLTVEGGRIDHAHHGTLAKKALADTVAMSEAVQKAVELTNEEDTLIVVTADHSHVLTMGGYTDIDTDLLGVVTSVGDMEIAGDRSGLPFLALAYTNGPGQDDHRAVNNTRRNLTDDQTFKRYNDKNYRQDTLVSLDSETHGGEDVAAFALGPWSHLFVGTQEQNYIAHAIMYSACLGPHENRPQCFDSPSSSVVPGSTSPSSSMGSKAYGPFDEIVPFAALMSYLSAFFH